MRIAMLSTNMARGGAETVVAKLSIELKRRGHQVEVVSMLPPSAFEAELAKAGIPLHAPKLPGIAPLLRAIRPQILHCHMFHANVCGRLLRLILPFPVVISTLHSTAESKQGSKRIRARDLAYRLTSGLADISVSVSEAVAVRHRSAGAIYDDCVIANGIDAKRFRRDIERRAEIRREFGVGVEFLWIAVGRLMWKKNFGALLNAMKQIPEATLLLAGSGPDEAELRANAGTNIRFAGERSDIPALLNAADGFVLCSVVEGLPLALLEAAACELPCVATDVGGVRETGVGMVVPQGELVDGMRHIMSLSPEVRAETGRQARERVVNRYSLEVVATQWEALYRTLTTSM